MSFPILVAAVLVAATVLMHATDLAVLLRFLAKSHAEPRMLTWPIARQLIHIAWWLIPIHVAEIYVLLQPGRLQNF